MCATNDARTVRFPDSLGASNVTPVLSPPILSLRARIRRLRPGWVLLAVVAWLFTAGVSAPPQQSRSNWPQWRGPLGNGVAPDSGAPLRFSATEGVKWKTEIPGRGLSTPVIWDDLVFVTTAVPLVEEESSDDRPRRRQPRLVEHEFRLLALRRAGGTEAWSRTATTATPHEGYHRTYSSFANASPVTDGDRVYAFFGSRGLYAYDFTGELVWQRDFEVVMETFGQFGEASSPALHGDTIVVLFDHQGQSFIEALDSRSGTTRWKQLRDGDTAWSSPLIVEDAGREMVIASGSDGITAYDLVTGTVVWQSTDMKPHPIPTPVAGEGLLFATLASAERSIHAIDLRSGTGGASSVRWQLEKAASYNPSALLWDNELYLVRDGGLSSGASRLSLIDAASGEPHYLHVRLPNSYSIKASPVGAGGRVYLATEEGDVVVIRRGPDMEVLAINPMGEPFIASPAIASGEIFLRGRTHLFCISGDDGS